MSVSSLTFDSAGVPIAADLHRPDHAGDAPTPCVVMAHGFSAVRTDALPRYAERFAAAGLAVLNFDYRGFGDSGGEPRQVVDIKGQLADWRAAIAHARGLAGVDPDRIVLWGTSFSGGHVITLAAEDERVAAAIAQVPFTDGVATLRAVPAATSAKLTAAATADLARAALKRKPKYVPAAGAPGEVAAMTAPDALPGMEAIKAPGSKWRNEVAARVLSVMPTYRPVKDAPKVKCPLLVLIADKDVTTPPEGAAKAAKLALRGEAIHYPVGHFEVYVGEPFERSVGDQLTFLAAQGLTAA